MFVVCGAVLFFGAFDGHHQHLQHVARGVKGQLLDGAQVVHKLAAEEDVQLVAVELGLLDYKILDPPHGL